MLWCLQGLEPRSEPGGVYPSYSAFLPQSSCVCSLMSQIMRRAFGSLHSSTVLRLFSVSKSLSLLFYLWADHKNNYLN